MNQELYIGDAVVPKLEPDHDVMTVYDLECMRQIALCNWVVGTRMFKGKWAAGNLVKVERRTTGRPS